MSVTLTIVQAVTLRVWAIELAEEGYEGNAGERGQAGRKTIEARKSRRQKNKGGNRKEEPGRSAPETIGPEVNLSIRPGATIGCLFFHSHAFSYKLFFKGQPRWPSGKASASRAEDPGFESRLRRDFFRVESYQ